MELLRRLRYLLPGRRAAEEREMLREFAALQALADPRELGNLTLAAENARAVWGWAWLASLAADIRFALRILARRPSFAAVAVVSLGLGIGANAAIYSLIDRVLWRQLPVADPGRLVSASGIYSTYTFDRLRAASSEMLAGMAFTASPMDRDVGGRPGRVEMVSGNYFELLGVGTAAGRGITDEDDVRGQPARVAVLSHRYWRRALGGSPVLGRTVEVTKTPFTIVGIAPPEFFGVTIGDAPDIWVPLSTLPDVLPGRDWLNDKWSNFGRVLARLRPGITVQRAGEALTPFAIQIQLDRARAGMPEFLRRQILASKLTFSPLAAGLSSLRTRFYKPLHVLFAMVGIGLLLACVNVMSLQFARADERRRELNVRLAIGAGRARVVRQLLTEAMLVSLLGGALGLAICSPAAAAVTSLISLGGTAPVRLDLAPDSRVLAFVLGVSLSASLVCGLIPALRATRGAAAGSLQGSSRGTTAAPARRVLVRTATSVQLGLSVVLIAGAFLFAFNLYHLTRFDTGVNRHNLVILDVDPKEAGYHGTAMSAMCLSLLDRLRTLPGVESATFSSNGLYTGRYSNNQIVTGQFEPSPGTERAGSYDNVGPGYFATVGARLVAGRDFTSRDDKTAPKVTVVNAAFARHFFPEGNPIGRNIYVGIGAKREAYQVIGVVDDIRHDVRAEPRRTYYLANTQVDHEYYTIRFLLRTAGDPAPIISWLRGIVRAENAALRVDSIQTADQLLNRTLDLDRLVAALSFAFGVLAVTLAAVGVYGLLAYDVVRRTPEIGIRMALGATRGRVVGLVLREVALVATVGVAMGLAAALALGRLVEGMVFQLRPGDPRVLAGAIGLLALVAAAAALAPASRAAAMDPMRALRNG